MKIGKKILRSLVAATLSMTFVLTGCSSGEKTVTTGGDATATPAVTGDASTDKQFEKIKIAYATNSVDETFMAMKTAYDNVIAPTLNIEFIYSEPISDAGALTTFIENAYAAGCQGVIVDLASSMDQAAAVCNDLGLYYVGISSADSKENMQMPYYLSVAGTGAAGYGESYAEAIKEVVGDGQEHSILIMSGAASYGATSSIEGTSGSLKGLQEVYGLTYTKDIKELATSATQIDAENDKGVKITVFPGMKDMATSVSPLLQSGEYDVLIGANNIYDSLGVAVDEVEKAFGKNIKFITRSSFSDAVSAAMNGKDSTGDAIINGLVAQGTYERVVAPIIIRNAMDGFADNMRGDGRCSYISKSRPLTVTSVEDYNALSKDNMPYAFVTEEEILSLTNKYNPDVTWETIDELGATLTVDNILKKFQ